MRLLTFGPVGGEQLAVLGDDDRIRPLAPLLRQFGLAAQDVAAALGTLAAWREGVPDLLAGPAPDLAAVRIGPPVPRPGKVLVIGANYRSFLAQTARFPDIGSSSPLLLLRPPSSVAGPYDDVLVPAGVRQLDYEGELAVVIGRGGRAIDAEDALGHVAGYMTANDLGACDVMRGDAAVHPAYAQPTRGKGFDTFCPTGPYLVTTQDVPDLSVLAVRTWVNGELRQQGSVADLVVGVPELVADVSAVMSLEPGDVILTGTPAGCGVDLPAPVFLSSGDLLETEVSGLGRMRTMVR